VIDPEGEHECENRHSDKHEKDGVIHSSDLLYCRKNVILCFYTLYETLSIEKQVI